MTEIQQIRAFNRTVTRRLGVLNEKYLGRDRPLAESRLLFEIGPEGAEVRELRARLDKAVPILIALTGYGQDQDRRRSEEAGFATHLVKPVDAETLVQLVDTLAEST